MFMLMLLETIVALNVGEREKKKSEKRIGRERKIVGEMGTGGEGEWNGRERE